LEFAGTSALDADGRPGPISLNALFGQRSNVVSPRFWRMLRDVLRFNKEALELLHDDAPTDVSLGDYLSRNHYCTAFRDSYLIPMSAAIWSTPHETMLDFPAATLVRFFHNHGLLGANSHLAWRTVVNGSRTYRDRITEPFRDRIRLARPATHVRRDSGRVLVANDSGESRLYDRVILACHADEALALLGDLALPLERELLAPFRYEKNEVVLHSDPAEMPRRRRIWTSWNYRLAPRPGKRPHATTVYWMNNLQGVSDQRDYFVSVNPLLPLRPELVHRSLTYTHPTFNLATHRAQPRLPDLNKDGPIFFCGSYFRHGFHEDALLSSVNVATRILGGDPWETR
jgi:predicted NAD/FAD-binding protein